MVMPTTPANQAAYLQPRNQKPGLASRCVFGVLWLAYELRGGDQAGRRKSIALPLLLKLEKLRLQFWQSLLDGVPNNFRIDVEVAVRHAVAHTTHLRPRNFRVLCGKIGMLLNYLWLGFADHQDVEDDSLLRLLVGKEVGSDLRRTCVQVLWLQACGRANRCGASGAVSHSYRNRFLEYLVTEPCGQVSGGENLDRNTKPALKLNLNCAHVQQGRSGQWINEHVKIASLLIIPVQHRTEHAGVARVVGLDDPSNFLTVKAEGLGGFHGCQRQIVKFADRIIR